MRSVSQIYSEAVTIRNNYLQLTELNSGRSNSKLSILNLITYVFAVCIHTYEVILDLFQVRLAQVLNGRINGTPDWYAMIVKKFQYNNVTEKGDELVFNEDTLKIEYKTIDISHRIVERAAWQLDEDNSTLILKVVKANTNSTEIDNGIPYTQLSDSELTALKSFLMQIKFVGAIVNCETYPADIVTVEAPKTSPIFYNDSFITEAQALEKIKASLIEFSNSFEFNGYLYYQSIVDAIRQTEYITDVGNGLRVNINSFDNEKRAYEGNMPLKGRTRLRSGYIRFLDENSISTINVDNLTLVPASQMDNYRYEDDNSCQCNENCNCQC